MQRLGEAMAAGAIVRAMLEAGHCRNALPAECITTDFWRSSSAAASCDDDLKLLAAAAPLQLAGYRKVWVKIGNKMAPTEVCTYLAGDFNIVDSSSDSDDYANTDDGGPHRTTIVFEPGLGSHTVGMCNVLTAVIAKLEAAGLNTVARAVCYDRVGTGESRYGCYF